MILVGCYFDWGRVQPRGLATSIDGSDDRQAVLFVDETGMYMLSLFNGQQRTDVGLTPETADAVIDLLLQARSEGIPQGEPA